MNGQLDVLALAELVARESESGKLTRELLTLGNTLYGKNPEYPNYIERTTPAGKKSLGHWRNSSFEEVISLPD